MATIPPAIQPLPLPMGDVDKLVTLYRELLDGACGGCTAAGRPVFARTVKARLSELIDDWCKLAKAAPPSPPKQVSADLVGERGDRAAGARRGGRGRKEA